MSSDLTGVVDGLSPIDEHFARLLSRLAGSGGRLAELAAHASRWLRDGHSCLDLAALAAQLGRDDELDDWRETLHKSPVVGRPGDWRPLILDDGGRLYLYRYWDYERRIGDALLARVQDPVGVEVKQLKARLQALFGPGDPRRVDWQRVAAATAAMRRLCVISGGPGTGKTYTLVRALALLAAQNPARPPVVGLAAPTGKAAARMQEAVREAKQTLAVGDGVRAAIPETAATIHRLLGVRPNSARFRHDRANPLPLDALVVDEASMIDLALMAKLLDALPPKARLILVGDGDQLASVEAGSVLADICGRAGGYSAAFAERLAAVAGERVPAAEGSVPAIADSVVHLRESRRFRGEGGIGQLARLINGGDADGALALLGRDGEAEARWRPLSDAGAAQPLAAAVRDGYAGYLHAVAQGAPAEEALERLNGFRVLCAHRAGPAGVEALNREIESALGRAGLIRRGQPWYPGRPVMVTQNDYGLRLYNGDIGIALPQPDGALRVCFAAEGGVRRFHPARLPMHQTVYAMTVHKTQGSEFERVLLILPPEPSRVVDRRLLYTAVTRARVRVELWGKETVLRQAIASLAPRGSGLGDRLWGVTSDQ
jgi:exodeoxyribonuclease V alpha subunit